MNPPAVGKMAEEEPITEPSPEGSRDYAVEVRHGGNTKRARLAALGRGSSAELGGESSAATGAAPAVDYDRPWTWRRFSLASRGQDRWDRLPGGWWVRHHVRQRMRPLWNAAKFKIGELPSCGAMENG